MRHLYDNAHFGRTPEHRHAMLGNMSASLFLHRRVVTTLAKAKYARRFAERMISFARRGDIAARRHVARFLSDKDAIKKLFEQLGPHFMHRNGGYTRIIHLGYRHGDAAKMAILELVGFEDLGSAPVEEPGKASKSKPKKGYAKSTKSKAKKAASTTKETAKKEEKE